MFKDLSSIHLTRDWFQDKADLQFTYDLVGSLILFVLVFLFQKLGTRKVPVTENRTTSDTIARFVRIKKIIAVVLLPLFFMMSLYVLIFWSVDLFNSTGHEVSFKNLNNLFYEDFFMILILVDILLLLVSFFYTNHFHKIIRNSGFIVSSILIRISFSVDGLLNTGLIVAAVTFGLLIIIIHNLYEKEGIKDHV